MRKPRQRKFNPNSISHYLIVGKLVDGKRFRRTTANRILAMAINLYDGRVYEVDTNHRRNLIKRVTP